MLKIPHLKNSVYCLLLILSAQPAVACESDELFRRATAIHHQVTRIAEHYGIDSNLIRAIIRVESNFNSLAVSPVGARGLMQLMPVTQQELGVKDVFDPIQNLDGGTRYFVLQLLRFNNVREALWAYNGGPTRIGRGAIPRESRAYANRVLAFYRCYSQKEQQDGSSWYLTGITSNR